MANRLWTKEEFVLTLDLYFRMPFGQISKGNPDIIKMADLINRTPSSVAMRLCNYAHCDPELRERGVYGLAGGYKQCLPYWEKYSSRRGDLSSEAIKCKKKIIESAYDNDDAYSHVSEWDNLVNELYDYKFQSVVKKNYHGRCAISGLKTPQLLCGCHIVPISEGETDTLDASNGIFLNLLYARTYVEGLIGIDKDYKIHISSALKDYQFDKGYYSLFKKYEGASLGINDVAIKPNVDFLEWHMDTIFDKINEI